MKKEKKKIEYPTDIQTIRFPMTPDFGGESIKSINKILEKYNLPEYSIIGFKREICLKKGVEYDATEVYITKF